MFSPSSEAASSEASAAGSPADPCDITVRGSVLLTYGSGPGSPPASTLKKQFVSALLCFQPHHARLLVEPLCSEARTLFLPLQRGSFSSHSLASQGSWSLQVRGLPRPHTSITLKLTQAAPAALGVFLACLAHNRPATAQELQLAARVGRQAEAAASAAAAAAAQAAIARSKGAEDDLLKGWVPPKPTSAAAAVAQQPPSSRPQQQQPSSPSLQLTSEQAAVLAAITSGVRGIFFTGSAGTGKSLLLQRLRDTLDPALTAFTASTGMAAVALGGTTIHAWAGLSPAALELLESGAEPTEEVLRRVVAEIMGRREAVARWRRARTLLIDEVSMLSAPMLDALERVARCVRGQEASFGGLQLVLAGDFYQLPPVFRGITAAAAAPVVTTSGGGGGGAAASAPASASAAPPTCRRFAFQAKCWARAIPVCITLTRVFRQGEDSEFIALLNECRQGAVSARSAALLSARHGVTLALPPGVTPTRLATHRASCEAENAAELGRLPGVARVFAASDSVFGGGSSAGAAMLRAAPPAPSSLTLKEGAQVMLTKSVDAALGLVNGARGVVIGFERERERGGAAAGLAASASIGSTASSSSSGSGSGASAGYPIVRFLGAGTGKAIETTITPVTWEVKLSGATVATRTAMPLQLAWTLSIHKSQGMTLDAVEVGLSKVFECGQAYVALSRGRSLATICLSDRFVAGCVRAHPDVKAFYAAMGRKGGEGGAAAAGAAGAAGAAAVVMAGGGGGGGGMSAAAAAVAAATAAVVAAEKEEAAAAATAAAAPPPPPPPPPAPAVALTKEAPPQQQQQQPAAAAVLTSTSAASPKKPASLTLKSFFGGAGGGVRKGAVTTAAAAAATAAAAAAPPPPPPPQSPAALVSRRSRQDAFSAGKSPLARHGGSSSNSSNNNSPSLALRSPPHKSWRGSAAAGGGGNTLSFAGV